MRKVLILLVAGMLTLGVGLSASAAPLNVNGTLTTSIGTDLPTLLNTFSGVSTLNGAGALPAHLGALRLAGSRGNGTTSAMVAITDPNLAGNGIASIRINGTIGTGTLGPISGGVQSTTTLTKRQMPIRGLSKVCLLSTGCGIFLPLELTQSNGAKGVGIGGLLTIGGGTLINISIEAAPWTVKQATKIDQITTPMTPLGAHKFINVASKGFAHSPASGTTSTAQPSGVVQLISPMQIRTNLAQGTSVKLSLFSKLILHFVPEPGMLLLLGSGVAGLVLLGRHRMRK
jgi:hypothetical protein